MLYITSKAIVCFVSAVPKIDGLINPALGSRPLFETEAVAESRIMVKFGRDSQFV